MTVMPSGISAPPPSPWSVRHAISIAIDVERAESTSHEENREPVRNTLRRPQRSANRPKSGIQMVAARM